MQYPYLFDIAMEKSQWVPVTINCLPWATIIMMAHAVLSQQSGCGVTVCNPISLLISTEALIAPGEGCLSRHRGCWDRLPKVAPGEPGIDMGGVDLH